MNLAIIFGGTSSEREVSINTGEAILESLKNMSNIYPIDFTGDYSSLLNQLHSKKIDLVFNALHGGDGENGILQLFLEKHNIRYTGSNVEASQTAIDKNLTKKICLKNNIPTPKWDYIDLNNIDFEQIDFSKLAKFFSQSCVIKPSKEGSSIGMQILLAKKEKLKEETIREGLKKTSRFSNEIIIEEYIKGRELTVGILDNQALPIVEIFPNNYFYDYKSKYTKGECDYLVPADLGSKDELKIKEYALQLNKIVGCRNYSRVDFLMDSNSNIFVLEINTLPGLTNTSLFPKAASQIGMSYKSIINKIVDLST